MRHYSRHVGVTNVLILDVPVELGLELMAVIGSGFFDVQRELFDDVTDEVDRVRLCMFVVNLECRFARRNVNAGSCKPWIFWPRLPMKARDLSYIWT